MDENTTDGQQAGTEGESQTIEQPSQVETPAEGVAEDTAAQTTGTEDTGQADEASDTPKRKPWWEKRFGEMTAKTHEAQREAAYWRGIAEGRQPTTQQQPAVSGPPTLEEHNWDEAAYQRANAEYYTKEAEKAAERVIEARTVKERQQAQQDTAVSRLQAGASKFADFTEVVSDIPTTDAVVDLLANNENAADILYELGKNPEAAAHFTRLSPYAQAMELGKIAARLEAPKATSPRTIPPPPPQTVQGLAAGANKSPDEMSMAEYVAWARERDKP